MNLERSEAALRRARAQRVIGAVALVACLAGGCTLHGDAQRTYLRAQLYTQACRAVWPAAVNVMTGSGFRLMAHDAEAGIANFLWNSPLPPAVAESDELVLRPSIWSKARDVSVDSAILVVRPQDRGCQAEISVAYGNNLVSSGLFEHQVLEQVGKTTVAAAANARPYARRRAARP